MVGERVRSSQIIPISRREIRQIIERIGAPESPYSRDKAMMYQALMAMVFAFARRISELVGRVYAESKVTGKRYNFARMPRNPEQWEILDIYRGVYTNDVEVLNLSTGAIVVLRFQVLKKYKKDAETGETVMRKVIETVKFPADDPFVKDFIMPWVEHKQAQVTESPRKIFTIGRSRAWQVIKEFAPETWLHWLRHQRMTHLSSIMNPWELKENVGKWSTIEPSVSYVHGDPVKARKKILEADEMWA